MRTSHVLAALLLSAMAAAASPSNALPDASTRTAITERAPARTWAARGAADIERSSARQRRDAASAPRFDGGGVVVIATSTMVLVIALLLLIALV